MNHHERIRRDELYPQWLDDSPELSDDERREIVKNAKWDTITGKAESLKIWQDANNVLWLGWDHRSGRRVIYARLYWDLRQIVCCVPRVEENAAAWKASGVFESIKGFRLLVPPGT